MRVTAELFRQRTTTEIELPSGATGLVLLHHLRLAPDAHLVVRDSTPIPLDEPLREGERLLVLSVVSGG